MGSRRSWARSPFTVGAEAAFSRGDRPDVRESFSSAPAPDDSTGTGIGGAGDVNGVDDVLIGAPLIDLNGCAVTFTDLGELKALFFTSDADADFDDDGAVNFTDLGIMKAGFFLPPGPSGVPNGCDE